LRFWRQSDDLLSRAGRQDKTHRRQRSVASAQAAVRIVQFERLAAATPGKASRNLNRYVAFEARPREIRPETGTTFGVPRCWARHEA
jgi:hypothetical protein